MNNHVTHSPNNTFDQRDQHAQNQTNIAGDVTTNTGLINVGAVHGTLHIQSAPVSRIPLQRPPRAPHFVDRIELFANILSAMQPGAVVTLCGPGGIGKSALAAEVIWHLAPATTAPEAFPDGILYHDFYNARQVDQAFEQIARAFDEESKPTPRAGAQRALAGRRAILVLDGAEQADDLNALLNIRDRCCILITSRRNSAAPDEWQPITPLPPDAALSLLQAWGRVRTNDTAVARQITELVGRLPLALQLIGHYLHGQALNAAEYLAWLTTTPLNALDFGQRQELSIPLLLEQSLELVTPNAATALAVIGVLAPAPFDSRPIAAALGLSSPINAQLLLGELVNYGFLQRDTQNYIVTHTLIHTYAREKLVPNPMMIVRLVAYYQTLVQAHQDDFPLLSALRPHLLTLLQRCVQIKLDESPYALIRLFENYLDLQGYWTDRITLIKLAIQIAQTQQDRHQEAAWLGNLGIVYMDMGQLEQAIAYFTQVLTISQELKDKQKEGGALGNLGLAYLAWQQTELALGYLEQALAISRTLNDQYTEGAWLATLGNAYADLKQPAQALRYLEQALTISRILHDRRSEGKRLSHLGNVYRDLQQFEKAILYDEQALAIAQAIGDRLGEASRLGNLGVSYYQQGQIQKAIPYYQQAIRIVQEIGDVYSTGVWLSNLAEAQATLANRDQALQLWQQALTLLDQIKHPYAANVRSFITKLTTLPSA